MSPAPAGVSVAPPVTLLIKERFEAECKFVNADRGRGLTQTHRWSCPLEAASRFSAFWAVWLSSSLLRR